MKTKYFLIKGGVFNLFMDEDAIESVSYDTAINEAYLMACEVYDGYAGLHGIMSENDYIEDGQAENEDEAREIYRDDRESEIDYEAHEITEEQYEYFHEHGELEIE